MRYKSFLTLAMAGIATIMASSGVFAEEAAKPALNTEKRRGSSSPRRWCS